MQSRQGWNWTIMPLSSPEQGKRNYPEQALNEKTHNNHKPNEFLTEKTPF
jgi:hypothetical protein